jgi:hypothetical protein|tara:strand:- start:311 stop:481 length:171 start_codon:yes stop_codon:yes gene_type:complete
VGGKKDLIIHQEYQGGRKSPLVTPASELDVLMYDEMARLNKTVNIIKEILEVTNEK